MLSSAGYDVTACGSGDAALGALSSPDPISLMVVDYAMPKMRGDQFAAAARRIRGGVPIVFITGHADTGPLRSEPWVLRKPFQAKDLVDTAEQAMLAGAT